MALLSSRLNLATSKTYDSGEIAANSISVSGTIAHGLGVVPAQLVLLRISGGQTEYLEAGNYLTADATNLTEAGLNSLGTDTVRILATTEAGLFAALASATQQGQVSTTAQTFAGVKTFQDGVDLGPSKMKWQKKRLASNVTTDGVFLTFNGLTIGKDYRVFLQANILPTGTDTVLAQIVHDSVVVGEVKTKDSTNNNTISTSTIITATATTVDFNASSLTAGSIITGNNTYNNTWGMIEELPNHVATTDFT